MKLEIYYDYVCPFCYVGLGYLDILLPKYPHITPEYLPIEIHPITEPRAEYSIQDENQGFWTKGIVPSAEKLGFPTPSLSSPVAYSNKAIEGFYILQEQGGNVEKYNREVFQLVFTHTKDIEDVTILAEAIESAGGNKDKALVALENGTYKEAVTKGNIYAYETNSIVVVPSFIAGERRYAAKPGWGITPEDLEAFLKSLK